MSIHIKKSHRGLLHKNLGVAQGKPISASKLAKAKNSKSAAVRKRATFAQNARGWTHNKGKKGRGAQNMSKSKFDNHPAWKK